MWTMLQRTYCLNLILQKSRKACAVRRSEISSECILNWISLYQRLQIYGPGTFEQKYPLYNIQERWCASSIVLLSLCRASSLLYSSLRRLQTYKSLGQKFAHFQIVNRPANRASNARFSSVVYVSDTSAFYSSCQRTNHECYVPPPIWDTNIMINADAVVMSAYIGPFTQLNELRDLKWSASTLNA